MIEEPKQHKLVPIDFKSLGVRQLGSIYEGLLEFKLRIADEKKAIVREKNRDVYVPFKILGEKERERAQSQGRIVRRGQLYLENDKGERKATGSYYNPDHIVEYIVQNAVGPVVSEKFEAMRPKLREAEQWHRERIKPAEAKGEDRKKYDSGPAVENRWYKLVNELFDLKILDPAMGSGHFLVETVDYITDKALAFLNSFPWNPVTAHLEAVRRTILDEMDEQGITIEKSRLTDVNLLKRHVLKRCIYGVDLNPMAVELAKVSLWLHCFTLGAPLSFLDHHMRCGNSLIGVSVQEVQDELRQGSLFGSWFAGLMLATDWMRHIGELSDVTTAQVNESKTEYRKASQELAPFKRILDVYTSQWFGNATEKKLRAKNGNSDSPVIAFLKMREANAFIKAHTPDALQKALSATPPAERRIARAAMASATERRFFHWELEFPEVFYGPRPGTERNVERLEGAGFDAVIGNPPFDELSMSALGREIEETHFLKSHKSYFAPGSGRLNWYHFFIIRAVSSLRRAGRQAFIVPMSLLADKFTRNLRQWLLRNNCIASIEVFPQKDDPSRRIFREAKLPTCVYVLEASRPAVAPVPAEGFSVRVHSGRKIDLGSPSYHADAPTIEVLDPDNCTIPLASGEGWELAKRLATNPRLGKLDEFGAIPSSGEIVFNEAFRKYITATPTDTLILRGSHVQRYEMIDEAKQGTPMYLKKEAYLRDAAEGSKAFDFQNPRVVYQECAAIDNWRRVIAAYLPAGNVCGHKICYFKNYKCPPMVLLGIFNSALIDRLVTAASTNNSLPAYLVGALPFPRLDGIDRNSTNRELAETYETWMREVERKAADHAVNWATNTHLPFASGCPDEPIGLASLVGHLAAEMVELHRRCAQEASAFLAMMGNALRPHHGIRAIQTVPGKRTLKNFPRRLSEAGASRIVRSSLVDI